MSGASDPATSSAAAPAAAGSRPLHERAALSRLLAPASVALVGASPNPKSLGGRTLANLAHFPGRLYPVNAKYPDLNGTPCYPSVSSLPEAPDCVVLAVPKEAIGPVLDECAARGAGAAVVLASGYAETEVPENGAAQAHMAALAARHGMRVVGPNCVGVANRVTGLHAAFAEFSPSELIPGNRVGLVSQSGALGLGLSHAAERGASITHVLTCGNSADVDVADYLAWLAEDDACDAIALAFEGVASAARLEEAARRVRAAGKRIAVCKLATSPTGQAATRFHTNTQVGEPAAWDALFARAGMLRITRIESLMETASFLAKTRGRRIAPGAAVISGSGGTAILAIDAAARHGVATPQPAPATAARLAAAIPAFGSPRNPCDATAEATRNPDSLFACADAMLSDPAYGALVIPWGRAQPAALMQGLGELAERHGKPVCAVWMSQRLEGPVAEAAERHPHIALFRSLDACFDALGQAQRLE